MTLDPFLRVISEIHGCFLVVSYYYRRSHCTRWGYSRVSISTPRRCESLSVPPSSSCSRAALRRARAFRMPTHASRPILSSCNPGLASPVPVPSAGMVTPSDGGTNPGGGALIAEGAMRDCRMCASDERMATCIDCKVGITT